MRPAAFVLSSAMALFTITFSETLFAEPWLSNRYAQNCAACHAPGRLNLPPQGRRCTLSCQGCHVNPNGGGMRNQYGNWNMQRWLKTFSTNGFLTTDKPAPAPDFAQPYVKNDKYRQPAQAAEAGGAQAATGETADAKVKDKKAMARAKKEKKGADEIPSVVVTRKVSHNEESYDYYTYRDWKVDAKSMSHFLSRVPKGDPWRTERSESVYASGDIRYIYGSIDGKINNAEPPDYLKNMSFLMAADFGVRYRPIKENLSFVFETRYSNPPTGTTIEDGFTGGTRLRSAYVLADMLPYNTWVTYGLYRPEFGYYHPDHNTLSQDLSFGAPWDSSPQNVVFRAIGAGGSPNVPFASFHLIQPMNNTAYSRDEGYNINLGFRAVRMSLSGKLSYWITENVDTEIRRTMYSVSLGGMWWKRFIANAEYLRVQKDDTRGDATNAGSVITLDTKLRIWRENYLVLYTATSDVTNFLTKGSATETMIGFKTFPVAGLELEILGINRKVEPEATDPINLTRGILLSDYNIIQFQTHFYF